MMTITFEGPQGCGKTRAALEVVKWANAQGFSTMSCDAGRVPKNLGGVDVLLIERQKG